MKLSNLLPEIGYTEFEITNDIEFETLSPCSDTPKLLSSCCTYIEKKKFISAIPKKATMIIASKDLADKLPEGNYGICYIDSPRSVFASMHNYLSKCDSYKKACSDTTYGVGCEISPLSSIAPKGVIIGSDVVIEEFVVIRENVIIGDRSIIRAGTVIGGQGFEINKSEKGLKTVEHVGGVVIGNDVEIQHNCCISRAVYPWDNTEICNFVKVGNLVQIGHGSTIKSNAMIAVGATITGNSLIGENTWIGPGAVVSNRLNIEKNAKVSIGSVVIKDVSDGECVTGNFAIPHNEFMYNMLKMERKRK